MSTLSEEQRRRIEENKRKALALRKSKQQAKHVEQTKQLIKPHSNAAPNFKTPSNDPKSVTSTISGQNVGGCKSMIRPPANSVQDFRPHSVNIGPSTTIHTVKPSDVAKPPWIGSSIIKPPTGTLQSNLKVETLDGSYLNHKPANFQNANLNSKTVTQSNMTVTNALPGKKSDAIISFSNTMPQVSSSSYTKTPASSNLNQNEIGRNLVKPNFYSNINNNKCGKELAVGGSVSSHRPPGGTNFQVGSAGRSCDKIQMDLRSVQALLNSPRKLAERQKKASTEGACVLISRTRFEAQIGYNAALIEVFKSMETRQYDAGTKLWTFDLTEYELFMQKVFSLDHVYLDPLPRIVRQALSSSFRGKPGSLCAPQADLSRINADLVSALMPFQREGVNFAIWKNGRVLIADDMGLGKTIQAICIACYYISDWPLLVVVPSSVRFAWRDQFLRWVPTLSGQDINVVVSGKGEMTSGRIIIISYDLMARHRQVLAAKRFRMVIMDESHFLKNSKTARTQAAIPLMKTAQRVILLSGTPALSRPNELFSQISAVAPNVFPKFIEFGIRYCAGKKQQWGWDFGGSSNMKELNIVLAETVMIRRLKKDVLSQLPDKQRQMVVLNPNSITTTKDMKNSHTLVGRMKGMDQRGALLDYFHQTGAAKLSAVREYVTDQLEANNKFLVFAHHQEVLNAIQEAVISKKYRFIRIDGRTNAEERNRLCEMFQFREDVRVAILSITAANAGLNLTSASLVVFAELFWNPGILVQAEDRAHRIGQQDCVNVKYLVASGTADDYIWPLVQKKLDVLGKAGLSKDNFAEADTIQTLDRHQRDIMSYFEESFFEDVTEDSWDTNPETTISHKTAVTPPRGSPSKLSIKSPSKQSTLWQFLKPGCSPTSPDKFPTKSPAKQKKLWSYMKPSAAGQTDINDNHSQESTKTNVEDSNIADMQQGDWLDDMEELWEEEEASAPWPKRKKLDL